MIFNSIILNNKKVMQNKIKKVLILAKKTAYWIINNFLKKLKF